MRWIAKAAVQKALSYCPGGERLNYLLQRHVTRQYPRSDDRFAHWARIGSEHFNAYRTFSRSTPSSEAVFYEFGTGWDLIIPFTYYGLGVARQTVIDIDSHLRFDLVNDSLRRFTALGPEIQRRIGRSLRPINSDPIETLEDLRQRFGITYLAPCDARSTGLAAESIDFVSSTSTLEHVPERDIVKILAECLRILKPGGLISCRVDMVDHFTYFDSTVSEYNFLKFPDPIWALLNSRMNFMNRLRRLDYLRIVRSLGFEIVMEQSQPPSAEDLASLGRLRLASRFRNGYSLEELGFKRMTALLRKPGGHIEN
jgi:SAM-dependent methyltransferase